MTNLEQAQAAVVVVVVAAAAAVDDNDDDNVIRQYPFRNWRGRCGVDGMRL